MQRSQPQLENHDSLKHTLSADEVKTKAIALGFHQVGIAAVRWSTGQSSTGQSSTGQGSTGQSSTHQGSTGQSSTGQSSTHQGSTGQSSTGHSTQISTDSSADAQESSQGYDQEAGALNAWLNQHYQATMEWMADPRRQDIQQVMPEVASVICVALNYYTSHTHSDDKRCGKISRYGWGRDYHRIMHKRLKALATWLRNRSPESLVRYYADTGPVQDKVWAERAGLGWIAKNSNLITRKYGSWVFLGEVLTTLRLEADRPHLPHCGSCTRCLDACPTGAIVQPFVVDANRCIAYHTIENRAAVLPEGIAQKLDGWVAGCDICQDVCPWNQRFAQETEIADFQPYPWNISPRLEELASLADTEWHDRFPASALRRIKPAMLRRNAQANLKHRANFEQNDLS